jgi:hypothetical protein
MNYARLSTENTVIEVFTPPEGFTIEDCFTPQVVAMFESCPDNVEQNWIKQADGTYVAPTPAPEPPTEAPTEPPVTE